MITISLCMIVKNEENILQRCLDSLKDYVDEIIIADTGSTDNTKKIAAMYTDKIYDYKWENDFSKARNFVFEKATMDYIYSADADEVLDFENQTRFQLLKEALLPEIDIVQMYYCNQLQYNTVYNFDKEYRPKLFKRIRTFYWIDPIHETIAVDPVIYDSDIEIMHLPEKEHAGRDFSCFTKLHKDSIPLSPRLVGMYVRELFVAGTDSDFLNAVPTFSQILKEDHHSDEEIIASCHVLAKAALIQKDEVSFLSYALKNVAGEGSSEICCMLGDFYFAKGNIRDAYLWYHNAAFETECYYNKKYPEEFAPSGLERCKNAIEKPTSDC